MRWNTLEQLPLAAFLASMGLYELRRQFDGTFVRVPTPLAEQYAGIIARGPEIVGELRGEAPGGT